MGNHADDAINRAIDQECLADEAYSMSLQEQYELGIIDEHGVQPYSMFNKRRPYMFGANGGLNGDGFFGEEYGDDFFDEENQRDPYYKKNYSNDFVKDKWYYHKKVRVEVVNETQKAYLLKDARGKFWIPKALVKIRSNKKARIYIKFEPKYLLEAKDEDWGSL